MSRKLMQSVVLVVVLVGFGVILNLFRVSYSEEAKQLTGKRMEMEKTISQAAQKSNAFQSNYGAFAKPVAPGDLDQVQKILISTMERSGLKVQTLEKKDVVAPVTPTPGKEPQKPLSSNGVTYEAVVIGSWEASMAYLNDLRKNTVLMQVLSIRMEAAVAGNKENTVKTTFKYKIFTES